MMGWNREKAICALAILVAVGSGIHAVGSFLEADVESVNLTEPRPATVGAVGGTVSIDWYTRGSGEIRDPFQAKSEWRPARPDPLGLPPYGALQRRVPLPVPVAQAPRAWPGRELAPPPDLEEDPDAGEEGTQ